MKIKYYKACYYATTAVILHAGKQTERPKDSIVVLETASDYLL